jgi:esterase/lipase
METQIKIPIGSKKYIYGLLRGSLKNPLIVFVHGLTGHCNEHIFYNGARFFEKNGYCSFRFNLYDFPKDTRKLEETTLKIHGQDLDIVVKYFKEKGIGKFFVVGHSWGAPTILMSNNKKFKKIVFWDPALETKDTSDMKYSKSLNAYILNWSYRLIIGKDMIEEATKLNMTKLLKEIKVPIKFIYAGEGALKNKGQKIFFPVANEPKELNHIAEALQYRPQIGS